MNHFCSCTDHACPFNPHNPKNQDKEGNGCDRCITKCLNHGEIPSCFFNAVSSGKKPEGGYTYRDFADFVVRELPDNLSKN